MQSELWGITTLFNPGQTTSRIENYRRFRKKTHRQGLPLVTVELAFEDAEFELRPKKDAEVLLQLRSSSVLWQKERLLNLGLAELPPKCKKVVWPDADIVFDDRSWVKRTRKLLDEFVVIQPFSECVLLPQGAKPRQYPKKEVGKSIKLGTEEGSYDRSVCYRMARDEPKFSGATGFAWAARRSLLDEVGFYDRCIIGGADREMALAFHFPPGGIPAERRRITHPSLLDDIGRWHEKVHALVDGRVGFRPGLIHHLWHGDKKRRGYLDRHAILAAHDFDPNRDIFIDGQGCWELSPNTGALARAIGDYFESREEGDGASSR